MAQSLAATFLVSILWAFLGYSLAFTGDGAFIGTLERIFLHGIALDTDLAAGQDHPRKPVHALPDDLRHHHGGAGGGLGGGPHALLGVSAVLRLVAAAGLCADRALGLGRRLPRRLRHDRFRRRPGGASQCRHRRPGLAYVIGARRGYGSENLSPFNLALAVIGTGLLWVGWLGFNGGSALGANGRAAMAIVSTHLAASAGAFTWMALEWWTRQAVGARHDLRRGSRPRHHHAGVRFRTADAGGADR